MLVLRELQSLDGGTATQDILPGSKSRTFCLAMAPSLDEREGVLPAGGHGRLSMKETGSGLVVSVDTCAEWFVQSVFSESASASRADSRLDLECSGISGAQAFQFPPYYLASLGRTNKILGGSAIKCLRVWGTRGLFAIQSICGFKLGGFTEVSVRGEGVGGTQWVARQRGGGVERGGGNSKRKEE